MEALYRFFAGLHSTMRRWLAKAAVEPTSMTSMPFSRLRRNGSTLNIALIGLTAVTLSSCNRAESGESDLEVSRIPTSELQATAFVQLNEDKPGTPVDVRKYLVPGKHTIVGYLSAYDDSSLNIEPRLLKLTEIRKDLAVRIVDINRPEVKAVDWESPIIQDLRIQSLPYFEIYDPAQALRAHGRPAYEQVSQWIQPIP